MTSEDAKAIKYIVVCVAIPVIVIVLLNYIYEKGVSKGFDSGCIYGVISVDIPKSMNDHVKYVKECKTFREYVQ